MLLSTPTPSDNASSLDNMTVTPASDAKVVKAKPVKKAKPAAKKSKAGATAATKKPAVKKAQPKASKPIILKPATPKTAPKKKAKVANAPNSAIFLEKDTYKALVAGLMDQGLEHGDAVDTLKVGLRQANGIPVPMALMMPAA